VATSWIEDLESYGVRSSPAAPFVRLSDYPVALGVRQQQRTLELMRELQLLSLDEQSRSGASGAPDRLVDFAERMFAAFGAELEAPREDLERAFETGEPSTELHYPLTADRVAQILDYARLMEEADELCREQLLINLEPDDEVYALRRWTVEEFVRQFHGLPPRPWPGGPEGGTVGGTAGGTVR
jgi:hypothetical protein